jgi:biotin transporter BioY
MARQPGVAHVTLAEALWSPEAGSNTVRAVVLVVIGSILLTISAKIQVPFWPVPMTMQTFVVLVLGVAYGWRLLPQAISVGVTPFLLSEAVKLAFATVLVPFAWRLLKQS